MSNGAFRDASAAIERAAMLEVENQELRTEIGELAKLRLDLEDLAKLRVEVEQLRAITRGENEDAYMKRLGEERDELAVEVRALREQVMTQQSQLARLSQKIMKNREEPFALDSLLNRLLGRK